MRPGGSVGTLSPRRGSRVTLIAVADLRFAKMTVEKKVQNRHPQNKLGVGSFTAMADVLILPMLEFDPPLSIGAAGGCVIFIQGAHCIQQRPGFCHHLHGSLEQYFFGLHFLQQLASIFATSAGAVLVNRAAFRHEHRTGLSKKLAVVVLLNIEPRLTNLLLFAPDGLTWTLYASDDATPLATGTSTRLATTVGGLRGIDPA